MLDIIGSIASILGLIASIAAWRAARSARSAAREARKAARMATASERLQAITVLSSELLGYVETGNASPASIRGRDLINNITYARVRWDRFLSGESKAVLAQAAAQVQVISRQLVTVGIPDQPAGKSKLLKFCQQINESLSSESARMLAEIESQEE
jgi:hypothetical protein